MLKNGKQNDLTHYKPEKKTRLFRTRERFVSRLQTPNPTTHPALPHSLT